MKKTIAIALLVAPALAGCSSGTVTGLDWWRKVEIEGNSTGGVIPAQLVKSEAQVQADADKWCERWGRVAKITFNSGQSGASVVFICEDRAPPPPPPPPAPPSKAGAQKKR
jgi:hypothetical protein